MPIPSITSSSTASGQIGAGFSYQITATNSPSSYSARYLPSGLALNTTSGLIEGYPETSGPFVAHLRAMNDSGQSDPVFLLTISIAQPTSISTLNIPGNSNLSAGSFSRAGASSAAASGISRVDSGIDAASAVLKLSAGTLKTIYGYNSGSAGYILIFDSATLPADGNTTGRGFAVPGTGNFSLDVNTPYTNGISLCISSTYASKTLAAGSLNFVATVV